MNAAMMNDELRQVVFYSLFIIAAFIVCFSCLRRSLTVQSGVVIWQCGAKIFATAYACGSVWRLLLAAFESDSPAHRRTIVAG
jgi:hypothetical protein